MAIVRYQIYRGGLALLVWLQKFEECLSTRYDIDLPEMDFLASRLSPLECYDFYRLLSHRGTHRGGISIYAEKEKTLAIPCTSLLTTWLTDPDESSFRTHENIELKLRTIGRKDLARWILGRIDSSLRRRQLDVVDADHYRRIEEPEKNDAIVRDRIGERIMPSVSLNDRRTGLKSDDITRDAAEATCVFWKIFFSVIIVIFLVLLFVCFYRFLYTKLRCICRRFADSEDRERCLPEQTYGTTSGPVSRARVTAKVCRYSKCPANDNHRDARDGSEDTRRDKCSPNDEANNEETVSRAAEETKIPPFDLASSTNRSLPIEDDFSPSDRDDKPSISSSRGDETKNSKNEIFNDFFSETNSKNFVADNFDISAFRCEETTNLKNDFFGDFSGLPTAISSLGEDNRRDFEENECSRSFRLAESLTELSETYDELGMLFSQQMKRQSRPCRRKYCPLARNLRRRKSRIVEHDERKCRSRSRGKFNHNIIRADQRPACSSGNICRDTYDEFELMRATRGQRESLARSIVERRKYFLDQPCVSPVVTRRFLDQPTDFYDQT